MREHITVRFGELLVWHGSSVVQIPCGQYRKTALKAVGYLTAKWRGSANWCEPGGVYELLLQGDPDNATVLMLRFSQTIFSNK